MLRVMYFTFCIFQHAYSEVTINYKTSMLIFKITNILTKFYVAIDGTYKFFYDYHSFIGTKHTSGDKQLKQTSSISNTGVS